MTIPRIRSESSVITASFSAGIGCFDEQFQVLDFCVHRIPFSLAEERVDRFTLPQKRRSDLLGGEPCLYEVEKEEQGVLDILNTLNEDEKNEMSDSTMPIRHFRAEKGNLENALASIRCTLQWRKQFDVDRIIKANYGSNDEEMRAILQEETETGILYARGYDAHGRCLLVSHPSAPKTYKEENQMKHLVYVLEKAIACTKRKSVELNGGIALEKFVVVCDYSDFKLSDSGPMSTTKLTLEILQKHYPERLHRAYVINPPRVFRVLWSIVRPFVDPNTKQKIVFCSGDEPVFEKFVKTVEHPEKLEAGFAGGLKTEARDYNAAEYIDLPFDVTFDE